MAFLGKLLEFDRNSRESYVRKVLYVVYGAKGKNQCNCSFLMFSIQNVVIPIWNARRVGQRRRNTSVGKMPLKYLCEDCILKSHNLIHHGELEENL